MYELLAENARPTHRPTSSDHPGRPESRSGHDPGAPPRRQRARTGAPPPGPSPAPAPLADRFRVQLVNASLDTFRPEMTSPARAALIGAYVRTSPQKKAPKKGAKYRQWRFFLFDPIRVTHSLPEPIRFAFHLGPPEANQVEPHADMTRWGQCDIKHSPKRTESRYKPFFTHGKP